VKKIYKRQVFGPVHWDKISTACIDRTHLNLRLFNRRLARLTLGFSKKLEHLKYSVALSIAHYNFCRVHRSLQGETPAMTFSKCPVHFALNCADAVYQSPPLPA
jgi:hypothetical protein